MQKLPLPSGNPATHRCSVVTVIKKPSSTPPPFILLPPTPIPQAEIMLSDSNTSIKTAMQRLRRDPLYMQEVPEENQLQLLGDLLEEAEAEETDIFDLLTAAVCAGPDGFIKFIEYLTHNKDLREIANEYHCSALISRLPLDLVQTILNSPEVIQTILFFQESQRRRVRLGQAIEA